MAKKASLGSAKRYGPRYGRRNKEKLATVESEHRGRRKCPYCNYVKVRRLSKGIWLCEKCDAKFASRAYTIPKKKKVKEVKEKEFEPLPEEPEEMEKLEDTEDEPLEGEEESADEMLEESDTEETGQVEEPEAEEDETPEKEEVRAA
ncbi:hypothetical protein KY362_08155 [Candidatus Woesearchaeota archaeon]|nr:hypothetical protein [Candidatus Woesearchaeota archaeon]